MGINHTAPKWLKTVRWLARLWSLPALLFMMAHLFERGEGDVQENWLTWVCVGTLFLTTFMLLLAWFKERIGGWAALIGLVLVFILYAIDNHEFFPAWHLLLIFIAGPAVLFLVYSYSLVKHKHLPHTEG